MYEKWLADRSFAFDASGIRKVFDLGAKLVNPVNLSIGQPDFDVPENVRQAACDAIMSRKNGYSPTQGAPLLREKIQKEIDALYGHSDRQAFVCSGVSGGLLLIILAMVNPGDEVIMFDPHFVMYSSLVKMVGATPVFVDTYPDFQLDVNKVKDAITDKTKMILFNSPCNPTGAVANLQVVKDIAALAKEKDIPLVSDEIYRFFCYDSEFVSPAQYNDQTIVMDGFSKCYGMPGWRLGYVHGPQEIIQTLLKFQQYSFVCAPHPFQIASVEAMDTDMTAQIDAYRRKRDIIYNGLKDTFDIVKPGGAFYAFPKAPWGTADEFVNTVITKYNTLVIPGNVFSVQNTNFRISFAATDETLYRGVETLCKAAKER